MADTKISALTASTTPLAGTEVLPIVQSGVTKKVSVANLTAGRAVDGSNFIAQALSNVSAVRVVQDNNANFGYSLQTDSSTGKFRLNRYSAGTETAYLSSTTGGDISVDVGNLVIGTSGKGIDFSATPGTGTSELLADYEEGDWTPVVTSGTGSITTSTSVGKYTKIGRQVTLTWYTAVTNNGTGAGFINVTGAPFSAAVGNTALFGYNQSTGAALTGSINGTSLIVYNYAGVYPVATGQTINCSITYIV
jgi:hypothetical protein